MEKKMMQAKTATEQRNNQQDSQRQHSSLDNRYGKIGISAVAAAVRCKGQTETVFKVRLPYDRD
jgi:hypothetical protein